MEDNYNYVIKKVFNNNVVLVTQNHKEMILIKKGLSYNKKKGDIINDDTTIEKIFILKENSNTQKFNQLIKTVENEFVGLCEEIIYMISKELGEELNEKIHISFVDHLSFTFLRLKNGDEIQNPFICEIETLYRKEYKLAEKVIKFFEKNLNINIPDGEIGFIALHIHSARNNGKLSNTIKYTYLCNTIIEYIEDELGIYIDRDSLDYVRFVIHMRFTIERLIKGIKIKNELLEDIKIKYSLSYAFAKQVSKLIEEEIHRHVPDDEIGYITMHIQKLKNAS